MIPTLGILRSFSLPQIKASDFIMTYYDYLFEYLFRELRGLKGVSILIETNDMYMARSLSFSYNNVKKNIEKLNEFTKILVINELTAKIAFVGRNQNLANSDLKWFKNSQLSLEGFIPDYTIKLIK